MMNTSTNSASFKQKSKPKSYQLNQLQPSDQAAHQPISGKIAAHQRGSSGRRNLPKHAGGDDDISEIDMNSDTRSMHSASVTQSIMKQQNNLMGSSVNEFYAKGGGIMNQSSRSGQMPDQSWAPSDSGSMHGNSNMFHPRGGLEHSLDQSEAGSVHELSNAKAALREARAKKDGDR